LSTGVKKNNNSNNNNDSVYGAAVVCCLAVISEMKEILLSELTIMEELGSGKFAVSGRFVIFS